MTRKPFDIFYGPSNYIRYSFYFPSIFYVRKGIILMKKLVFKILTHSYVLRVPEFIYAIFAVMYACMCICMFVCMCLNTIASKRCIRLSSNLVCILQITVRRTLLILVNIGWIVFLQEYKKEFLYIMTYGIKLFKVY